MIASNDLDLVTFAADGADAWRRLQQRGLRIGDGSSLSAERAAQKAPFAVQKLPSPEVASWRETEKGLT